MIIALLLWLVALFLEGPLLVGVREAARELGLGRDQTYQLCKDGRIRTVSFNRKVLIPRVELEAFIQRELERGREEKAP